MASKIKATTAVSIDELITAFDDLASYANTLNLLPLRVNVAGPLQLRLADGICTGSTTPVDVTDADNRSKKTVV